MHSTLRSIIVILTLCGLLASCTHASAGGSASERPGHYMAFRVGGACGGMMLRGVRVLVVSANGAIELGVTDGFGIFKVVKKDLIDLEPQVILFCHGTHFCGAFDVNEPRFFEYDEHYISLAPFAL